jgi:hypothetical protein
MTICFSESAIFLKEIPINIHETPNNSAGATDNVIAITDSSCKTLISTGKLLYIILATADKTTGNSISIKQQ